ncbi:hypothetical protein HHK36_032314 [Tetracentron sinense]|uniref:Uncharacterized protein n=1 Tax=Tetracentron sinense TaxID=13715 RepID=A0A835CXQ7_TETSI|nr:hypothetical protein HHK36_032314 [Tetracentron sinense]
MIESPKFAEFEVIWLRLPPLFSLHLIERNPESKLPEGPWSSTAPVADPKNLPRGHHVSFSVSNLIPSYKPSRKKESRFLRRPNLMERLSKRSSSIQMVMAWRWGAGKLHNNEKGLRTCKRKYK